MPSVAWYALTALFATASMALLFVLLYRRRRFKNRIRRLKIRIEALNVALSDACIAPAKNIGPISSAEVSDAAVRTLLITMNPKLADPVEPDLSKVNWLRQWVYENIPQCKFGKDLDPIEFDIFHKPVSQVLQELVNRRTGFKCG